eukprot:scaffold1033_cov408-Prasinococcus_capsulatus_cf.AAC.6
MFSTKSLSKLSLNLSGIHTRRDTRAGPFSRNCRASAPCAAAGAFAARKQLRSMSSRITNMRTPANAASQHASQCGVAQARAPPLIHPRASRRRSAAGLSAPTAAPAGRNAPRNPSDRTSAADYRCMRSAAEIGYSGPLRAPPAGTVLLNMESIPRRAGAKMRGEEVCGGAPARPSGGWASISWTVRVPLGGGREGRTGRGDHVTDCGRGRPPCPCTRPAGQAYVHCRRSLGASRQSTPRRGEGGTEQWCVPGPVW